jgi:N-acetylglucosaminyldiphosphoundecaprenol N-acetyl-beta-D-mannosaminyltransferase
MKVERHMRVIPVIGLPCAVIDYAGATEIAFEAASRSCPFAISAANTHLATLSRMDAAFHEVMAKFDLILPDGMPLVWVMNRKGAGLADRVYGPYFMKRILELSPPDIRHFFFGSSEIVLADLCRHARAFNPSLLISGTHAPPFGPWSDKDRDDAICAIESATPHFVWVALGGGRQERWIIENLSHFSRGVFCAVGDAFPLLAGHRPFASAFLQRLGLTWLHRLCQEPRRLFGRYLYYNTRFVWYAIKDLSGGDCG